MSRKIVASLVNATSCRHHDRNS